MNSVSKFSMYDFLLYFVLGLTPPSLSRFRYLSSRTISRGSSRCGYIVECPGTTDCISRPLSCWNFVTRTIVELCAWKLGIHPRYIRILIFVGFLDDGNFEMLLAMKRVKDCYCAR